MPVIIPPSPDPRKTKTPRLILYHQTHYSRPSPDADEQFLSAIPLATTGTGLTHLIIAALHINEDPQAITLNDDRWDSPRARKVWDDARALRRDHGIPFMAMLGGAAKGTYAATRLDSPFRGVFQRYYEPLKHLIGELDLDGIDLDVEEPMSLPGIIRLITHLHADFGSKFIITLAPVAPALAIPAFPRLSGFDYWSLEVAVGHLIAWYNVQFYCGWGTLASAQGYADIVARGWDPRRLVAGTLTNPEAADGWVEDEELAASVARWNELCGDGGWGGIMGWEYWNAFCVRYAGEPPDRWAAMVGELLGLSKEDAGQADAPRGEDDDDTAQTAKDESQSKKVAQAFEA